LPRAAELSSAEATAAPASVASRPCRVCLRVGELGRTAQNSDGRQAGADLIDGGEVRPMKNGPMPSEGVSLVVDQVFHDKCWDKLWANYNEKRAALTRRGRGNLPAPGGSIVHSSH
jgi:hypothetical protein